MEIAAKKTLDGKRDYLPVARTLRDKLAGLITSRDTNLGTQRKILFDVSQELDLVLANKATHRYVGIKTLDGKRDYLRVARTLRDKLAGLITSRATNLWTQRKILFDVSQELDLVLAHKATHQYAGISICTHSCCEHEQVLNPALWSALPLELLQQVFAKLPFSNICRLPVLSKEWKLSLQSSISGFTLALKEFSPRILARVTWGGDLNFGLHVLDERKNRWHELHVSIARGVSIANRRWEHMNGAADAGLVCYVHKDFHTGLNRIYVINPMTGVVNQLPNLSLLTNSELTMMRIIVDRNTFHYKVIVVKHAPPVEAEVYNSEVQQWTKPKPSLGRIFGIAHDWSQGEHAVWRVNKLGPCAYDCRDGKYHDFGQDEEKWLGEEVISYTLLKDRLFVLYYVQYWEYSDDDAFIVEYCVSENATSWVKEETHYCPEISWMPEPVSRIHACNGFLFMFVLRQERGWIFDPHKKLENGWVFDLATHEWRALPPVPWRSTIESQSFLRNAMCELHWNIQP